MMLEILVVIIFVMMAKARGRRSGRNWIKGTVLEALAAGALASSSLTTSKMDVVAERTFIASIWAQYAIRGHTAGEGPIRFGVAHGDYADAEIEEFLEQTASWDESDLVAREISSRKIREIGTFSGLDTEEVFNDGRMKKTKLGWILNAGATLSLWIYNASGATLTIGSVVSAAGHVWLQPK